MVLGKLPMPGRPTIWMIHVVGQGLIVLAVGAVRGCLDLFTLSFLSFFTLSPGDGPI